MFTWRCSPDHILHFSKISLPALLLQTKRTCHPAVYTEVLCIADEEGEYAEEVQHAAEYQVTTSQENQAPLFTGGSTGL